MDLIKGCVTSRGNYRNKNQDSIMCERREVSGHLLAVACVCDGIGSFENSEIAAQMMKDGIRNWLDGIVQYYPNVMNKDMLVEDLEVTICELNEVINQYRKDNLVEIGCTMSLLLLLESEYYVFHVGDSRIYCLQNELTPITRDEVILKSVHGREKKLLANYIGKSPELCINRGHGYVNQEEIYILCSDGLYKKLMPSDYLLCKDIKNDNEAEKLCKKFISMVIERGERDNISCAVLKIIDA